MSFPYTNYSPPATNYSAPIYAAIGMQGFDRPKHLRSYEVTKNPLQVINGDGITPPTNSPEKDAVFAKHEITKQDSVLGFIRTPECARRLNFVSLQNVIVKMEDVSISIEKAKENFAEKNK